MYIQAYNHFRNSLSVPVRQSGRTSMVWIPWITRHLKIHLLLFICRKYPFICVQICFITVIILSWTPIWPSFVLKERSRITFVYLFILIQNHQDVLNNNFLWHSLAVIAFSFRSVKNAKCELQIADCRLGLKCRLQTGFKMETET